MPRIVRILVYEGPQEWLEATLANKNRAVKGDWILSHQYWTLDGREIDPPRASRVIREAILPSPDLDEANLNSRALAIFDEVRGERSAEAVQAVEDLVLAEHLAEEERSQEDYR